MNEQPVNDLHAPWQAPRVERLDVSRTLGATQTNSDNGLLANNAFPNPSLP
jgi:hypothetical protein